MRIPVKTLFRQVALSRGWSLALVVPLLYANIGLYHRA